MLSWTDWFLLTYVNRCPSLNPYFVLGISVLPNLIIGLISIVGRAKAFGLTVIIVGFGLAVVGTGLVVGLSTCFP
jgi:hypothetical protein